MKIDLNKIEFDMNEFGALLLQDKQEGFRRIGEKFLNAVLEMEFAERTGAQKHLSVKKYSYAIVVIFHMRISNY